MSSDTLFWIAAAGLGAFAWSVWAKTPPPNVENVASAGTALVTPATSSAALPRGIRNKNPGNIKYSASNKWQGQLGKDSGGFVVFSSDAYGLRAMAKLLRTYITKHGLVTVGAISRRWSPDTVGLSGQYAATVAQVSGVPVTKVLTATDAATLAAVMRGMVAMENGVSYANYYPAAAYQAALSAA